MGRYLYSSRVTAIPVTSCVRCAHLVFNLYARRALASVRGRDETVPIGCVVGTVRIFGSPFFRKVPGTILAMVALGAAATATAVAAGVVEPSGRWGRFGPKGYFWVVLVGFGLG